MKLGFSIGQKISDARTQSSLFESKRLFVRLLLLVLLQRELLILFVDRRGRVRCDLKELSRTKVLHNTLRSSKFFSWDETV